MKKNISEQHTIKISKRFLRLFVFLCKQRSRISQQKNTSSSSIRFSSLFPKFSFFIAACIRCPSLLMKKESINQTKYSDKDEKDIKKIKTLFGSPYFKNEFGLLNKNNSNYRLPLQRDACTKNQNSGFSPCITLHLAHCGANI
ncbi:hypothetical protein BpHYR1_012005 [Brachionus plicatilis]|uniref:Uncharacterized protein n=1 Tax=Brachionus plicatilis TaxID=10195 RepID=A0A3M7QQI1_BRAPC|nr:hypothetical protein BpHYR1_012005 [Brachionus plicatilis]